MHPVFTSLLGIVAILALAFLLSTGKRRIRLRVVAAAFALQALLAFIVLRTPWGVAGNNRAGRLRAYPDIHLHWENRQIWQSIW